MVVIIDLVTVTTVLKRESFVPVLVLICYSYDNKGLSGAFQTNCNFHVEYFFHLYKLFSFNTKYQIEKR